MVKNCIYPILYTNGYKPKFYICRFNNVSRMFLGRELIAVADGTSSSPAIYDAVCYDVYLETCILDPEFPDWESF